MLKMIEYLLEKGYQAGATLIRLSKGRSEGTYKDRNATRGPLSPGNRYGLIFAAVFLPLLAAALCAVLGGMVLLGAAFYAGAIAFAILMALLITRSSKWTGS
jgi:hypothetical protein